MYSGTARCRCCRLKGEQAGIIPGRAIGQVIPPDFAAAIAIEPALLSRSKAAVLSEPWELQARAAAMAERTELERRRARSDAGDRLGPRLVMLGERRPS